MDRWIMRQTTDKWSQCVRNDKNCGGRFHRHFYTGSHIVFPIPNPFKLCLPAYSFILHLRKHYLQTLWVSILFTENIVHTFCILISWNSVDNLNWVTTTLQFTSRLFQTCESTVMCNCEETATISHSNLLLYFRYMVTMYINKFFYWNYSSSFSGNTWHSKCSITRVQLD